MLGATVASAAAVLVDTMAFSRRPASALEIPISSNSTKVAAIPNTVRAPPGTAARQCAGTRLFSVACKPVACVDGSCGMVAPAAGGGGRGSAVSGGDVSASLSVGGITGTTSEVSTSDLTGGCGATTGSSAAVWLGEVGVTSAPAAGAPCAGCSDVAPRRACSAANSSSLICTWRCSRSIIWSASASFA